MSNPNTRKSCVVPKCTNTTTNAPEKLFFVVPMDVQMRKKWIKAMKRLDAFGAKSKVYCCEDHFDIETDMENYVKYKLVGGRIKLKQGIVPHKFCCQKEKEDKPKRSAVQKRNKIKYFEKLLSRDDETITLTLDETKKPEKKYVACCKDETVIEDPLSYRYNDQNLEISKKNEGVQVKLKDKDVPKSTMTEEKYFKKDRIIALCTDTVSVNSTTDISFNASSHAHHAIYNLNEDSNISNQNSDTENPEECQKHFIRNDVQKAALICISREPEVILGLP